MEESDGSQARGGKEEGKAEETKKLWETEEDEKEDEEEHTES